LPVQERIDVYAAIPTPQKALIVFQGGSHSIFTDRSLWNGGRLNPLVKRATIEAGLAFLDLVHRSDPVTLEDWTATWRPIPAAALVSFQMPARQADRRRRA